MLRGGPPQVPLLTTVLDYVRVTDDVGDEIVQMLVAYVPSNGDVKNALVRYNEDEYWLLTRRQEMG